MSSGKKTTPPPASGVLGVAIVEFLDGLTLEGSERVLGALALELAGAIDEVPPYSKPSVARELRAVLAQLAEVEVNAANLGVMEGIE